EGRHWILDWRLISVAQRQSQVASDVVYVFYQRQLPLAGRFANRCYRWGINSHLQRQCPSSNIVRPFCFTLSCQSVRVSLWLKKRENIRSLWLCQENDVTARRYFLHRRGGDHSTISPQFICRRVCSLQHLWSI